MYLISAYFDSNTNKILQKYIDNIAAASGNQFMVDNNVPPHLTLSAIEAKSVDVLVPAFENLRGRIKAGEIEIVTIGQIMPKVIYAAPYLNSYLNELSKSIYSTFADISETTISKYYKPLSWLPHITLGKTLTISQMQEAFKVTQDFKPFTGQIVRVGLAKVNPHEDVSVIEI